MDRIELVGWVRETLAVLRRASPEERRQILAAEAGEVGLSVRDIDADAVLAMGDAVLAAAFLAWAEVLDSRRLYSVLLRTWQEVSQCRAVSAYDSEGVALLDSVVGDGLTSTREAVRESFAIRLRSSPVESDAYTIAALALRLFDWHERNEPADLERVLFFMFDLLRPSERNRANLVVLSAISDEIRVQIG